jgi:hypothetical protein
MRIDIRDVGESICYIFDTYMHFRSLGDLNDPQQPVKAKLSHTSSVIVAIVEKYASDRVVKGSLVDA